MKETKHYTALIFDVIESRKFKDRFVIQAFLKNAVEICNSLFQELLCKPVMFSAGDEMQGLFYSAQDAYRYFAFFSRLAYPVQLRCGIGFGELDVFSDDWMTTELDGPAYHRAREAIALCHEGQEQPVIFTSAQEGDRFINGLLGSYLLLSQAMKPKTTILYIYAEFLDSHLVPKWEDLVTGIKKLEAHLVQQQRICKSTIPSYKPSFSITLDTSCFEKPDSAEEDVRTTQLWKRGLNGRIAQALGIRRQYVDAVVRTNNFARLRCVEILICEMLQEVN
ncbi:MAG TPA: SatD family protein [Sphaerochaeta sp.]|nr:SatD family protein [Sphaerochaeta sp.]